MPVDGTSSLTRVQLARLTIDYTKNTPEIQVLSALMNPTTRVSAFIRHTGNVWSPATQDAFRQFVACLEGDVARTVFSDGVDGPGAVSLPKTQAMGLAEHLTGSDVPDM